MQIRKRREPRVADRQRAGGLAVIAGPSISWPTQARIRVVLNALGTVTPLASVTVKTQINGQLVQVGFRKGQVSGKGDFLAQIDPRPYQIARDQALSKNFQLDLQRHKTLVAQDSIARQQLDTQASLVQRYIATVRTAQAAVDSANLRL